MGNKQPKTIKSVINWTALNDFTGGKYNLRKGRVPKKHKERVNLLLEYIENWINEVDMYSEREVKDKIKAIKEQIKRDIDQIGSI